MEVAPSPRASWALRCAVSASAPRMTSWSIGSTRWTEMATAPRARHVFRAHGVSLHLFSFPYPGSISAYIIIIPIHSIYI